MVGSGDTGARMHTMLNTQQQGQARHKSACAGVRGGQDFWSAFDIKPRQRGGVVLLQVRRIFTKDRR